jgi:hypothetical protein
MEPRHFHAALAKEQVSSSVYTNKGYHTDLGLTFLNFFCIIIDIFENGDKKARYCSCLRHF